MTFKRIRTGVQESCTQPTFFTERMLEREGLQLRCMQNFEMIFQISAYTAKRNVNLLAFLLQMCITWKRASKRLAYST